MRRYIRESLVVFLLLGALLARADDTNRVNKIISSSGTLGYLGLGLLLPLIQDGSDGQIHALRSLDSLVLSVGISTGLQHVTNVRRPNSGKHDAFPSDHATAAFAIATMQSQFHPSEAPLWYLGAAVIANSRVQLHEHTWGEVVAGAALGWGTARLELSSPRGLLIYPIVNGDGQVGVGMMLSRKF